MNQNRQRYVSYVLRLWQVTIEGQPVWRASLESALTGERRGFANLEDLFEFLREETAVKREPKRDDRG